MLQILNETVQLEDISIIIIVKGSSFEKMHICLSKKLQGEKSEVFEYPLYLPINSDDSYKS